MEACDITTSSVSFLSCSCSHLIIEHGTKKSDGPSLSHQGPGKKKKKRASGSPFQDVEAGFSLGGPATDKDGRSASCCHVTVNASSVRILLCLFIIDSDYFIHSSCITS